MKHLNKSFLIAILLCMICFFTSCNKKNNNDYLNKGFTSIVTFNFNGGSMDNGVTNIVNYIKYAYKPNSKIADPTTLPRCSVNKDGYNFGGWYLDNEFLNKWDFTNDTIGNEPLELYAKWEKKLKYSYMLRRKDENGNIINIYEYIVNEGNPFNDTFNKAKLENYTVIGYYDEKGRPWNKEFKHPGGDKDLCINVYAKYIKGEYTLVSTYNDLINASGNIYLLNDIDCSGQILDFGNFKNILEGNNYKISNFVINAPNGLNPKYGIFKSLEDGAQINNVKFEDAIINSPTGIKASLGIAALVGTTNGKVIVNNVSVSGRVIIDENLTFNDKEYKIELKLDQVAFNLDNADLVINNFNSNLVLEDKRK